MGGGGWKDLPIYTVKRGQTSHNKILRIYASFPSPEMMLLGTNSSSSVRSKETHDRMASTAAIANHQLHKIKKGGWSANRAYCPITIFIPSIIVQQALPPVEEPTPLKPSRYLLQADGWNISVLSSFQLMVTDLVLQHHLLLPLSWPASYVMSVLGNRFHWLMF